MLKQCLKPIILVYMMLLLSAGVMSKSALALPPYGSPTLGSSLPIAVPSVATRPDVLLPDAGPAVAVRPDVLLPDAGPAVAVRPDDRLSDAGPAVAVRPDVLLPDAGPAVAVRPDDRLSDAGPAVAVRPDVVRGETVAVRPVLSVPSLRIPNPRTDIRTDNLQLVATATPGTRLQVKMGDVLLKTVVADPTGDVRVDIPIIDIPHGLSLLEDISPFPATLTVIPVFSDGEQGELQSIPFRYEQKWRQSSPTLADVDRDYALEVVVASSVPALTGMAGRGRTYVMNANGTIMSGWPQNMVDQSYGAAAVGDLDTRNYIIDKETGRKVLECKPEIVVCDESCGVYIWNSDGTPNIPNATIHWYRNGIVSGTTPHGSWPAGLVGVTQGAIDATPALGDVDNDGDLEIVIGDSAGYVYVVEQDGTLCATWLTALGRCPRTNGWVQSSAAIGDINNDGKTDVVVGSDDGRIYAWSSDGSLLPGWPVTTGGSVHSSPALANINKGGRLEVFVGSNDGYVYGLLADGTNIPGWPKLTQGKVQSSPAVADINGDNRLDIVVGCDAGFVYAWNMVGSPLLGWPVTTGCLTNSSPAIADVDYDNRIEVVIGLPRNNGEIMAWNADGTPVLGWPKPAPGLSQCSPALGELDEDGSPLKDNELEVVAAWDDLPSGFHVHNTGRYNPNELPWPQFRHDKANTGNIYTVSMISSIVPSSGTVGTMVTVTGQGYCPSYTVGINFKTAGTLTSAHIGADGMFTATFVVPHVTAGTYIIVADAGGYQYDETSFVVTPVGPDPFITRANMAVLKDGHQVNTNLLVPGETYELQATIGNNEPMAATGVLVVFKIYSTLGIGLPSNIVGTRTVDLAANGSSTTSVFWKVPTSGHGCYVVEIDHPSDIDLTNNRGQWNMETVHIDAGDTHVNPFQVGNPTAATATVQLQVTAMPSSWSVALDEHTLTDMAPGEVRTATVRITLPLTGGSGIVRVEASISGQTIGYIEKHVNIARISVTPSSGPNGRLVTVRGIGYQPGEYVQVNFGTTLNVAQATVQTDSRFETTFSVTDTVGTKTVRGIGITSGRVADDTFRVIPYQSLPMEEMQSVLALVTAVAYIKNNHPLLSTPPIIVTPPIKPVVTYNQAPGDEFWVDIQVGETASPVSDLYGLSFRLNYDTSLLDVVTPYDDSIKRGAMLSTDTLLFHVVDEPAGRVSISNSRKGSASGVSGSGVVAQVKFRLRADAVASNTTTFSISNVAAIDGSPAHNPITLSPETADIHVEAKLDTPVLISPYNNALANQVDVDYKWGTVTGAAFYMVEIDNNSNFSSPEYLGTTTATMYNPTSLYGPLASSLPDGTYFWHVRAMAAPGDIDSNWSETRSVRVTTVILDPKVTSPQISGGEFWVDVHVGSDTHVSHVYPVQDLFAISFSLFYERTDIIDVVSSSIERGSFLGTNTIMLYSVHDDNGDGRGRIDISISRLSGHAGVTGYGSLVKVKFVSAATEATGITFSTSDVGYHIAGYNSGIDPIYIGGAYNRLDLTAPIKVWPGDTNNNGIVDEQDILPIAIYDGMTGHVRPSASLRWTGQPMPYPWTPVRAIYADTNGDGKVNERDVLAVALNMDRTHTVTSGGSFAPALEEAVDYSKYVDAFRRMYKVLEESGIEIKAAPALKQVLSNAIQKGVEQQEIVKKPAEFVLGQSYPNPFNPECWIPFELAERAYVVIRIYNISGQLIKTLDMGMKDAGAYTTQSRAAYWDGHNADGDEVASGVYMYQLQVGGKVMTQRAVVCK